MMKPLTHTQVPRKLLGQTDIAVSGIGLGTVKFGRNSGVKYPQGFTLPTDAEAQNILSLAKEFGVNLIDTAPAYGTSEERLGTLLHQQRNDWIICSKAGEDFIDGESHYNFSPTHIRSSVEQSLRKLNTDFIDIVLLHSNGEDLAAIEQGGLDTLADMKREGLIRAYGMSTKTVEGGIAAATQADCVMVTYNPNEQTELPVIDFCLAENKGVLLKKVLGSGHFDRTLSASLPNTHFQISPLQHSMNFVFSHPGVTTAIVGTINPHHLEENIKAAITAINIDTDL